jgi:hypothetical protein
MSLGLDDTSKTIACGKLLSIDEELLVLYAGVWFQEYYGSAGTSTIEALASMARKDHEREQDLIESNFEDVEGLNDA